MLLQGNSLWQVDSHRAFNCRPWVGREPLLTHCASLCRIQTVLEHADECIIWGSFTRAKEGPPLVRGFQRGTQHITFSNERTVCFKGEEPIQTVLTINEDWRASQEALGIKNPPANAGDIRDVGSIPGSWRFPEGGHDNPFQFLPGESHGQRSLAGYSP